MALSPDESELCQNLFQMLDLDSNQQISRDECLKGLGNEFGGSTFIKLSSDPQGFVVSTSGARSLNK